MAKAENIGLRLVDGREIRRPLKLLVKSPGGSAARLVKLREAVGPEDLQAGPRLHAIGSLGAGYGLLGNVELGQLGMVALRLGKGATVQFVAFAAAVASFAYIVGAAINKSPLSWLAQIPGY